jgi:uncharacterized membrane protein YecN with MAPEG domain
LAHKSSYNCGEIVRVDHANDEIKRAHPYRDIGIVDTFQYYILLLANQIRVRANNLVESKQGNVFYCIQ